VALASALAACGGLLAIPSENVSAGSGGVDPSGIPDSGVPAEADVDDRVSIPAGDRNRDVLDTTLAVDVAKHTAVATITLAPSPSAAASFEIGDLDIRTVRHGTDLLPWIDRGNWLDIEVPPSNEPLVIAIEYEWHFHSSMDGISPTGYTLTWPYWCGNVFPCRSQPSDGTTFHLHVGDVKAGRVIYPEQIPSPAPPYMAAWIVGDWVDLDGGWTAAGTHVVVRSLPNDVAAARIGTAHLTAAFGWLEKNIGPYRFGSEVGPVAAIWNNKTFGGMEHHPFWHIDASAMGDESVHLHEAAHGWFGNGVRLRCWEDFVLSEGTASYLAFHALQQVAGSTTAAPYWASYIARLRAMQADGQPHVAWPGSCGQDDILKDGLYTFAPYIRGALFYRAVEGRIGAGYLELALRTFYQRWAGKAAGMQDMLDVITEVSGYNPRACAKTWLTDAAVPDYGFCPP
jgi:aminopeptidase N